MRYGYVRVLSLEWYQCIGAPNTCFILLTLDMNSSEKITIVCFRYQMTSWSSIAVRSMVVRALLARPRGPTGSLLRLAAPRLFLRYTTYPTAMRAPTATMTMMKTTIPPAPPLAPPLAPPTVRCGWPNSSTRVIVEREREEDVSTLLNFHQPQNDKFRCLLTFWCKAN